MVYLVIIMRSTYMTALIGACGPPVIAQQRAVILY